MTPAWSIRLLGGFEVRRPNGTPVRFRTRKAEALVAVLTLHEGIAVRREELAEALWPNVEREKARTNLRQALAHAKEAFEPEIGIEANRDGCRLCLSSYECDATEVLHGRASSSEALLPEMTEAIFDSWRTELSVSEVGGTAAAALPTLLGWALSFEPARVLELLHAAPELASALPLKTFKETLTEGLESTQPSDPLYAWGQLQLANILMWQGAYGPALRHAKEAIRVAQVLDDRTTWSGGMFTATFLLSMKGRWDRATDLAGSGRSLASEKRDGRAMRRFDHALGQVQAYRGDVAESLKSLRRTSIPEPEPGEETAWAFRTIHQSCYWALMGRPQEAWQAYHSALGIARRLAHPWLDTQVSLARAYTLLAEGRRGEARPVFDSVAAWSENLGLHPITVHALEGAALSAEDPSEADRLQARADAVRAEHELPVLPLDELRLRQFS